MIDERHLADPDRCPSCAAALQGARDVCRTCGLGLAGAQAGRLWQLSLEAARVLEARSRLLAEMRAGSGAAAAVPAGSVPFYASATAGSPSAGAPLPVPPPVAAAPRREWTPQRVQNLLLALGVGLVAVAAVIFVAVAWGDLGVGTRAAVMTGMTAVAAVGTAQAWRRGLTATAEALALLTVTLALLDCLGAWAADLAGLGDLDGLLASAASTALVATAAGLWHARLRARTLRLSAAVLAQLPLVLVVGHLADTSAHPAALLAGGALVQALALAVTAGLWAGGSDTRDARWVVTLGAVLASLATFWAALVAAYAEDGSLVVGTVLLVLLAAALAALGEAARPGTSLPRVTLPTSLSAGSHAAAAGVLVLATWAPLVDGVAGRWVPAATAAAALVLLLAARAVPTDRRAAPALVWLAAAVLPALLALGPLLDHAALGRLAWVGTPWSATPGPAFGLLRQDVLDPLSRPDLVGVALVLLVAGLAAAAAPLVRPALGRAWLAAPPLLVAAGLAGVPALSWPYAAALAADLVLGGAALAAGTLLLADSTTLGRPGLATPGVEAARRVPTPGVAPKGRAGAGVAALASGAAVLGLAVTWSLAVEPATQVVLPAAAAVLGAAVLLARGVPSLRGARTGAGAAAALLLVAEAAAVTRGQDADWPAVAVATSTTLLVLALVAAALTLSWPAGAARGEHGADTAADRHREQVRAAAVVVAVVAALAEAAAIAWQAGVGLPGTGLAVSATAGLLLALGTLDGRGVVRPGDVRFVAAVGGVAGLLAAAADPDRLWLALLSVGVGASVVALRVEHRAGWVAGLLLAASSWVRLAIADVDAPEAYTVPPAAALLLLGWRRRSADPSVRSWPAYAPGLLLALVPSLLRAGVDAGDLRPLLLGLAALGVLAVGVARRLQAPLVVGAGVLAVDALVQLAPYLVVAYDVVPRWVSIGTVGLALLVAGASYERRLHDLRRVGRRIATLG